MSGGAPRTTTTTTGRRAAPLRGAARGVPAGRLGGDPALPLHPASPRDALLPGLPPEAQPLGLGALHRRHAPGDPLPRARRLFRRPRLGALGARLRQHEDGDERPGYCRGAGLDARPRAARRRVRLPPAGLRPGGGEPEGERRVLGDVGQRQPPPRPVLRGRRRPRRAGGRLARLRERAPLRARRRAAARAPAGGGRPGRGVAPHGRRLRAARQRAGLRRGPRRRRRQPRGALRVRCRSPMPAPR